MKSRYFIDDGKAKLYDRLSAVIFELLLSELKQGHYYREDLFREAAKYFDPTNHNYSKLYNLISKSDYHCHKT